MTPPISTIGRPVQPRYPTNKAILIATLAIAVVATAASWWLGQDVSPWRFGLLTAIGGFLAWALARELDPDRPWTAFGATAIASGAAFATGPPALGLAFAALLCLRIINRTPGPEATVLDRFLIGGLAMYLAFGGAWYVPVLAATAFALDALQCERPRLAWASAGLLAIGAGVVVWFRPPSPPAWFEPWAIVPAILAGVALWQANRSVASVCDHDGTPLHATRVQWSIAFAVMWVIVASLWASSMDAVLALGAALVATGAGRLVEAIRAGLHGP